MKFHQFKFKSLIFAPLEGITDEAYRSAILKSFPEWDVIFTDFLRVPSVGKITDKLVSEHVGKKFLTNEAWKKKTAFQILAASNSQIESTVKIIEAYGFEHLDLNLGCPSHTVNSHHGGAYLLDHPKEMLAIVKTIRKNFSKTFTIKMRIGVSDDLRFAENLKLLESEGVEAITLHARTKNQLYTGVADWNYIKMAVENLNIPVIGNGDIWTIDDIDRIFHETHCHSIMCGRAAMKTPWLATIYQQFKKGEINNDETFLMFERKKYIHYYFENLLHEYREHDYKNFAILKRFKSLSRYLFDDLQNGEKLRSDLLRTMELEDFLLKIENL